MRAPLGGDQRCVKVVGFKASDYIRLLFVRQCRSKGGVGHSTLW